MDPRNTHEKTILTHKVPMRENFRSTNTHPQENFRPHQIPTRKNFGPTKYPRENILDPRNTHEKKLWAQEIPTKARWHDSTKSTRPTMARDPRNLAHCLKLQFFCLTYSAMSSWINSGDFTTLNSCQRF